MFLLRRVSTVILLFIIALEFLILAASLNIFQVKYVVSQGLNTPLLYQQGNKNIFRFDTTTLAGAIEKENPQIKNVIVRKKLPDTLILYAEERKPLFIATDRSKFTYFIADSEGVVFAQVNNSALPVLQTERISLKVGVKLDRRRETTAVKYIAAIDTNGLELKEIIVGEKGLHLGVDSVHVVVNADEYNKEKLKALQILLKRFTIEGRKPREIDLRFEKPVVKFNNE